MKLSNDSASDRGRERAGLRILVVEDTLVVADEIQHLLRKEGCEVVGPVSTLDDALRSARDEQIDGALLDINLHGKPAYPVADTLITRQIPVVFITGYSSRSMPEPYRGLPCLEKPFSRLDFSRALERSFGNC